MKTSHLLLLILLPVVSLPLRSQTVTNAPLASEQTNSNPVISKQVSSGQLQQKATSLTPTPGTKLYTLTPDDVKALTQQGYDPATLPKQVLVYTPEEEAKMQREKEEQLQQNSSKPTPPELKNAGVWMDNFLGMTNATIIADVISMKPEALKFRFYGQDYDYSGHYTVVLNTPRQHKNPYFGFGSPDKAKFVILDDFGGQSMPLPNPTIWEKRSGFIVVVALGKEWIYSGTYTIQN